jgi:tetratricopeptide (TPR) repeat protein
MFKRGLIAKQGGNFDLAKILFARLVDLDPNWPEFHYQLGTVEQRFGEYDQALGRFKIARQLRVEEPNFWFAAMDILIAKQDPVAAQDLMDEARSAGLNKRVLQALATKVRGGNSGSVIKVDAATQRAFAVAEGLYSRGRFADAEKAAKEIVAQRPGLAPGHALLGAIRVATGQRKLAIADLQRSIQANPNYVEGHTQLGQLHLEMADIDNAKIHLDRAYLLAPTSPQVRKVLGSLYLGLIQYDYAEEHLIFAMEALPQDKSIPPLLARALTKNDHPEEALIIIDKLIADKIDNAQYYQLKGEALAELQRSDEALAAYEIAKKLNPSSGSLVISIVLLLKNMGEFDQVLEYLQRFLSDRVLDGSLAYQYAFLKKMTIDDELLPKMEQSFDARTEYPGTRVTLAYALAKAMEDTKQYDRVFGYLRVANDDLWKEYPMGASSMWGDFARTTFQKGIVPAIMTATAAPPRAIFICGMPRSGTTLVEQIISSHSDVTAGGELEYTNRVLNPELEKLDALSDPITGDRLNELGAELTRLYHSLFPDAKVVTDKSIATFEHIGLLKQALPDGSIIVVRRDPRDNCLSMYKNNFGNGRHRYTTDLKVLAENYLHFLNILKFWRTECPGSFYEIRYEDLIGNPEAEARKLVDHCQLDWEDACLSFYDNKRSVKTLSAFQVRQPIYSSSVGAWRRHEKDLEPLIQILRNGGALDEWD